MVAVDLQSLIGKINQPCRRALEAAVGMTASRTHYNVEIEHWLSKLMEATDGDVAAILRHFEIDPARVATDLNRVLEKLKTGNSRAPSLSPDVVKTVREAWVIGSLQYGEAQVRSGHLMLALLADEYLAPLAHGMSSQFRAIQPEALKASFVGITRETAEEAVQAQARAAAGSAAGPGAGAGAGPGGPKAGGALDQYTVDLTATAAEGGFDPILGRDAEIRQIVDILTRRRQNNPILTGEAGVGKTAVVEGFAQRIASGDVPPALRGVTVRSLDLGLLQAGAGMKGEFENRLKGVIEEVKASETPIIMFIDEAHTLIGAGGAAGQNDAANLLKPALARGELRTIAATTWAEYKKYFEKDPALTRRFQVVKIEEPSEKVAIDMMRGMVRPLQKHHGVRITTDGVVEAVRLSSRYIPARQLPDKSVSLLDTACARVAMSQSATPAPVEDRQRTIGLLTTEIDILEREKAIGQGGFDEELANAKEARATAETELAALTERWDKELALVKTIRAIQDKLEEAHERELAAATAPPAEGAVGAAASPAAITDPAEQIDVPALEAERDEAVAALTALQGEEPLVKINVDAQAVAEVVANWTGVPVGRMVSDEIRTILALKEHMSARIKGQDHALAAITQSIWTSRAKLTDPRKPIGVFLMVGTSGVGKTETALTLAELLYGGEQNVTTINMSEYKEEHKVSLLMGSPPGYVGYGEGGVLTEAVRRRPYSIVLLDEMEKAHPGVQDLFYQVFDKGMLKDGEGRDIDFKNTIIIMTSNAGTEMIESLCADPETMPDAAGLAEALRPDLLKTFKPAFLGRCTLVPYFPLSDAIIREIVVLNLERIRKRVTDSYKAAFTYAPVLVETIAARCTESETGARNIEHILSRGMLPELSSRILGRLADGLSVTKVHVDLDDGGHFTYALE